MHCLPISLADHDESAIAPEIDRDEILRARLFNPCATQAIECANPHFNPRVEVSDPLSRRLRRSERKTVSRHLAQTFRHFNPACQNLRRVHGDRECQTKVFKVRRCQLTHGFMELSSETPRRTCGHSQPVPFKFGHITFPPPRD